MSKKIVLVEDIPDIYQDLSSITNLTILYHRDDRVSLKSSFMYLDRFLQKGVKVQVALWYENILAYPKFKRNENIDHLKLRCKDYILFKSDLLLNDCFGDVSELTKSIKNVVKTISCIPDPIARSLYIDECAKIFKVETQILVNESNKIVGEKLKERVAFRVHERVKSQCTTDDTQSQKETLSGDEFQIQDSLSSLKRLSLRKLKKMLERNQLKIKELSEGNNFEQVVIHMKLHEKIKSIHDDLAKEIELFVL
jgi:DNA primase